jgi:hypothetical protein
MVVPGTAEIVALTSIQIFLPITGTTWTVVLSTASAFPELTGGLEELLRAVAQGISTVDPGADWTTSTDEAVDEAVDDEPDQQWIPAHCDTGTAIVGFERGLRTVVLRPTDPPSTAVAGVNGSANSGRSPRPGPSGRRAG